MIREELKNILKEEISLLNEYKQCANCGEYRGTKPIGVDTNGKEVSLCTRCNNNNVKSRLHITDEKPKTDEDGFGSNGIGHIKDLWKFTKPPTESVKEYFVVGGERNYGEPVGPGTGPSGFEENKKYQFKIKKLGEDYIVEINKKGKLSHSIHSKSIPNLIEQAKYWINSNK